MTKPKVGHCRQKGCPNTFTEIVGQDGWGKKPYGDCIPCWMAASILSRGDSTSQGGLTLEQVADHPQMREMMEGVLKRGGWTWSDLEASYARKPVMM